MSFDRDKWHTTFPFHLPRDVFFCGIKNHIMQRANADFCGFNAYLL
jgi:hypothetical protein